MADIQLRKHTRAIEWLVYRNPMYLLSAACLAVGARMLLVSPSTRAGDVGRILLTLGILELYEALVATIVIALHRSRRAPEDIPSILLVAVLFWTGPLAATAEMTSRSRELGCPFAVVACLIALTEMVLVRRQLGLNFSVWTRFAVSACIILLTAAPTLLKMPDDVNGINELFLYLCWWVLAVVALLGIGTVQRAGLARARGVESLFFALVLAATAVQLWGMNYGFFGHAELFYASPLLIAITVIAFTVVSPSGSPVFLRTIIASMPALAIYLSLSRFDSHFPLHMLPFWLRKPDVPVLFIAAGAWWYGYLLRHGAALMHTGNAALGCAVLRIIYLAPHIPVTAHTAPHVPGVVSNTIILILYAVTAYLLIVAWLRRSNKELLAAILVHQIAVICLIWERTPADMLFILQAFGVHWLIGMHIVNHRPPTLAVLCPIILLVLASWAHDFDFQKALLARASAAMLIVTLSAASWIWPSVRYRRIALAVGSGDGLFYAARWMSRLSQPTEAVIVAGAFVLLALAVVISWYKVALLRLTQRSSLEVQMDCEST